MQSARLLVVLLLVAATAGCAGVSPPPWAAAPPPSAGVEVAPLPQPIPIAAEAAAQRVAAESEEPYRLDSGDRLRVVVFGQEGLTNSYVVDSTGAIMDPDSGLALDDAIRAFTPREVLLSCLYGGMVCGPKMLAYAKGLTQSAADVARADAERMRRTSRKYPARSPGCQCKSSCLPSFGRTW